MTVSAYFRTNELAKAAGISVQHVRNYEAKGFLPPVERSPSGYRRYTRQHLVALLTARHLNGGYGTAVAQQIMQAVHSGALPDALTLIDQRHAELASTRGQLEQTKTVLGVLATQLAPALQLTDSPRMHVGAAARQVGVRVSALRFWEQQGLLQPIREQGSKYRLYDEQQLRRLRIIVLLRQAHYDFDAIRTTLNELDAGQPQRAVAAVEQRRRDIASMSWRCFQATAALHSYIHEFLASNGLHIH